MTRKILAFAPMIARAARTTAPGMMLIALAGCAAVDTGDYPSLARRPIESVVGRATLPQATVAPSAPATTAPPELVSATLSQAVRALAGDADRGDAAFHAAIGDGSGDVRAASGAAVGSEAWAVGQRAYSRIEAARSPTTLALTELDRLTLAALDREDAAAVASLEPEQQRVAALVRAQEAALAGLAAGLGQ